MPAFFKYRVATLSIALIVSACGGGGGDNSSVPQSGATTLAGAVIDGYLKGATVCLDVNANLACDSGEPNTKSLDKGAYSLSVPAGTDTSNLHVIAIVDSNTIDADTGKAPDKGYTLMAPAKAAAAVTPLTTFISHTQQQNPQMSLQQATSSTVAALGLNSGTDITQDYVAKSKPDLHRVAQLTAALLGETIDGVVTAANPKTTDEKREALLTAMEYAKTQAGIYSKAAAASTDAELKTMIAQASAKAKKAVDDNKDNLAKEITDKVVIKKAAYADIASIFKDGIFSINNYLIFTLLELKANFINDGMDYSIEKLVNGKFTTNTYTLSNGDWTTKVMPSFYFDSKTATWLDENFSTTNLVISSDGKTRQGAFGNSGLVTTSQSFKELNVSGKNAGNLSYLWWGSCLGIGSNFITICDFVNSLVFPETSKVYVPEGYFEFSSDLFSYEKDCEGFSFGQGCSIKTIKEVNDSTELNSLYQWFFEISKTNTTSGTLTFFDGPNCSACAEPKIVGTGKYTISDMGNRKVFRITEYKENSPGSLVSDPNNTPLNALLVEDSSGVYPGDYIPKGVYKFSEQFSPGVSSNRTAITSLFNFYKFPNAF